MQKRVLVVDDNPVSRELVREVLDLPDLEILEAADGREALDKISASVPDLVLLDIRMPDIDGFEVLRQVRQDPKLSSIRIVAFTAFAMRDERQRALAAGFDGYLTKPIDAFFLREQVKLHLVK
jgi:two-component system, cell cycle response regulator DivK